MKTLLKRKVIIPVLAITILFTGTAFTKYNNDFFEIAKQIEIFTTLFKELNMNYVDETNPGDLMDNAIKNMLNELDPYTRFYNEQDVEAERIKRTGDYTGVGARIKTLKDKIIKKIYLITPNIPEAEILTNMNIHSKEDMISSAKKIINFGAKNVLIKGGHLKSTIIYDVLVSKDEIKIFKSKKHTTKNTHGTGCTLSSAITSYLSCGELLKKSCELGIKYVNQAIRSNISFCKGHGPINHLNSIVINKKFK